ncbi:M48 family metalloprotease [Streptomyces sp. NPDC012794]|uniref:M48 family metalloprotease n=1 Tax=Streptomyces sp. NPDC012794 TaxID=3364850 RepID=UPI0036A999E6
MPPQPYGQQPPGPRQQTAPPADPRFPQQGHPYPGTPPVPPQATPPAPPAAVTGSFHLAPPAQAAAPGHPAAPPPQPYATPGRPYAPTPSPALPQPPQQPQAPQQPQQQPPQYAPGAFATPPPAPGFQAPGNPPAPVTPPPATPPTLAKPEPGQAPPMPAGAPVPAYQHAPAYDPAQPTAAYDPAQVAAYDPAQPAPYDPGAPPPIRRGADASSITTLLLHLPLFLGSFVVIWLLSQLLPPGLDIVFVIAWLASGALMFHRPTERALARLMFKVREPTAAEMARLRPIWHEVTGHAGIDGSRYDLWVEDSNEINAFAAAGHIVSVTRRSLNELPEERLAAVLAHELGHHVGGHAWAGLIGIWYAFPARFVMGIVKFIMRGILFVVAEGTSCFAGILALIMLALAVTFAVTFPPALALLAIPFLLAWAGRRGELRADRFAGEIGYGPQLHAAFTGLQNDTNGGADDGRLQQGLLTRLMATHPPVHQRIRALDPFVAAADGPAAPTGGLPS